MQNQHGQHVGVDSDCAGLEPGFNWRCAGQLWCSARLGQGALVVEADEYDSRFRQAVKFIRAQTW